VWIGDVERRRGGEDVAGDSVGGGWVGEVERRCGRGRCLLAWSVGQGPMRGLLCGAALEALASAIPVPLGKGGTSANGLTNRVVRSTISTAVKCSKYSLVSSHVIVPGYSRCEVNAMLYVT
jgi:hypothetical protein